MTGRRSSTARVAELRARTADALTDLYEIQSLDPAACHAMQVVRLTRRTLESFWVPTLDDLTNRATETGSTA